MKIYKDIEQKSEEWKKLRQGKITGTGLSKVVGGKVARETYLYELLAERLATGVSSEENAMDRGNRLESVAIEEFEKKTGKIVEIFGFCEDNDNEFITNSPDGLIDVKRKYSEAIEVKCLASGKHVRAWLENEIPSEYYAQAIQYFIVNEDLEKLYFVLYDPRIAMHPLHVIELNRDDIEDTITEYREKQEEFLEFIEEKLSKLIEL
jgi:putative phage-type endonuclease